MMHPEGAIVTLYGREWEVVDTSQPPLDDLGRRVAVLEQTRARRILV